MDERVPIPTPATPSPAAIRKQLKLSQSEFAALLDVSVRTIQEWEQGRREPSGPAKALLRILAREPEILLRE
jgi:putative transcriptional regulator